MTADAFFAALPYEPDPFQVEAVQAVVDGRSVVVSAPTGSGKTLVAEAAIQLALGKGRRAFYTTPLKALSNQKYGDFCAAYGRERVGLLTGDNSINGGAPIVVMTTEVLRNMIYADTAALDDLHIVVLDEVHYLQDRFRGAVWEEIIIHAPPHIRLVCLSATVSNADEFTAWVRDRRGPTELILEETRPVPLESLYMIRDRFTDDGLLLEPVMVRRKGSMMPNPEIVKLLARRGSRRRYATPRRSDVVAHLDARDLLPAIYFIFSRAGCEDAAQRLVAEGAMLTTPEEREFIRSCAAERTAHLNDTDLAVLAYDRWLTQLEAGIAAHHAGMVPAFKETVEELFLRGLVRVVFATETLSLGINMPAKTVVLESLSKFTGESHEVLRPGEYTQLTGRAGRRGIDVQGYGIVLYSPFIGFDRVAEIATAGAHALRSSFRPTYNMAANLVANYARDEAERLLNASFGQFQRRTSTRNLRRLIAKRERRLEAARNEAACERGDVWEYFEASRAADQSGHAEAAREFSRRLRPGHVIEIPTGKRSGRYVVVKQWRGADPPRLVLLSDRGSVAQFRAGDLTPGTASLGTVALPKPYQPRNPRYRQSVASELRSFQPDHFEAIPAVRTGSDHPVAACPGRGEHLKAARTVSRMERDLDRLRQQLLQEGEGLVGEFRSILDLLSAWGYVSDWSLTPAGRRLRFVYNELDLLLADVVERGAFADLEPPEIAALASCFVFEPRGEEEVRGGVPASVTDRWGLVQERAAQLNAAERARRLPETRLPHPGFAELAFHWAAGTELEDLLGDDLAAGDFVRTCRQLIDLLRQIRDAHPALSRQIAATIRMLDRGVVAAGGTP